MRNAFLVWKLLLIVSAPAFAASSTWIIEVSTGDANIIEIGDGKQLSCSAFNRWEDYLGQATKLLNALETQGYKIVGQSEVGGYQIWTAQI
jgi:hypothetical protein